MRADHVESSNPWMSERKTRLKAMSARRLPDWSRESRKDFGIPAESSCWQSGVTNIGAIEAGSSGRSLQVARVATPLLERGHRRGHPTDLQHRRRVAYPASERDRDSPRGRNRRELSDLPASDHRKSWPRWCSGDRGTCRYRSRRQNPGAGSHRRSCQNWRKCGRDYKRAGRNPCGRNTGEYHSLKLGGLRRRFRS